MKLLNFANLEFKWEEEKEIYFSNFHIQSESEFKYEFYHPVSFYLRIDPDITRRKNYYHSNFIIYLKILKRGQHK